MAFIETPRFPDNIARGSSGGPSYNTSVITYESGAEKRNANWLYPIHRYQVAYGVRHMRDLEQLIAMFHAARGRANAFRYKDFADFKSCALAAVPSATDQTLGTADGATAQFQLIKTYVAGASTKTRQILKPVTGTVKIALGGVEQPSGWTVDTTTGMVTFTTTARGVIAVNQASKWFAVAGNVVSEYSAGQSISITGSTGNNGVYTVVSATYTTQTQITVSQSIPSSVADGTLTVGQPNAGSVVTAGYEFDVPVRFDSDTLSTVLESYQLGSADVPLIEVRNP